MIYFLNKTKRVYFYIDHFKEDAEGIILALSCFIGDTIQLTEDEDVADMTIKSDWLLININDIISDQLPKREMEAELDYEQLLNKYMRLLQKDQRSTFLYDSNKVAFTETEWNELKRIARKE